MPKKAELEREVKRLRLRYRELEEFLPVEALQREEVAIHPGNGQLLELLEDIVKTSKNVFSQLSALPLHEKKAMVMLSDSDKTFLDNAIRPRYPVIRDLYIRYHRHGWFEDFFGAPDGKEDIEGYRDIAPTLRAALNFWDYTIEDDDDRRHAGFDFAAAWDVVESPYFRPDSWWLNAKTLEPVIQKEHDARIPPAILRRLEATYASFVFENWIACVAMARTTLEFALRSRAPSLNVSLQPARGDGRSVSLEELIDRVANKSFSELHDAMHKIRTRGNAVMHPTQEKRLESPTQESAFELVTALKKCVECLYRNP